MGVELRDKENIEVIDQICEGEKLDMDNIKRNPILKPLVEINKSFVNFELLIRRAMWEYGQHKKSIDDMIESNPKYSETMIVSKIQNLLTYVKQIVHSQDLQKEDMKRAIKEMIKIVKNDYGLLEEDSGEEIEEKPKEEMKIADLPEKEVKTEETPDAFFSDLIEKEIPFPKDKGE